MGGRKLSNTDIIGFALIVVFSILALYLLANTPQHSNVRTSMVLSSDALVVKAGELEAKGEIQEALTLYREAINRKPSLCDPKSGEFLGRGFEKKINLWIRELKSGELANRERALENAAYIFRKLNGGCG